MRHRVLRRTCVRLRGVLVCFFAFTSLFPCYLPGKTNRISAFRLDLDSFWLDVTEKTKSPKSRKDEKPTSQKADKPTSRQAAKPQKQSRKVEKSKSQSIINHHIHSFLHSSFIADRIFTTSPIAHRASRITAPRHEVVMPTMYIYRKRRSSIISICCPTASFSDSVGVASASVGRSAGNARNDDRDDDDDDDDDQDTCCVLPCCLGSATNVMVSVNACLALLLDVLLYVWGLRWRFTRVSTEC